MRLPCMSSPRLSGRVRRRRFARESVEDIEHRPLKALCASRRPPLRSQQKRLLSELPQDLMVYVLGFLRLQEVCASISLVNRTMFTLSRSRTYLGNVRELRLSQKAFAILCPQMEASNGENAFGKLMQSLRNLNRLEFNGCPQFDDWHLRLLSKNVSRRFQSLTVDWCGGVTDEGIVALAKVCPELANLSLFKGRTAAPQQQRSRQPIRCITDRSLQVLSASCSKLTAVCLAYTQLTKQGIEQFAEQTNLHVHNLIQLGRSVSWGPTSAYLVSKQLNTTTRTAAIARGSRL